MNACCTVSAIDQKRRLNLSKWLKVDGNVVNWSVQILREDDRKYSNWTVCSNDHLLWHVKPFIPKATVMLMTLWCWWLTVGDNFGGYWCPTLMLRDAYVNANVKRMLVTEMTKTVTNILKLSPTHFVSNIRQKHRCNRSSSSWTINFLQTTIRIGSTPIAIAHCITLRTVQCHQSKPSALDLITSCY